LIQQSQLEETDCWIDERGIEGQVPLELEGTFIRNGPGLVDVFGTPLAHPIDGDGMLVTLTFVNGKVHFRNKYTETFSHVEERKAKKMLYNGNMGSRVAGGAKSFKMRDPAHTNAFYWGSKILACHEYALPHAIDPVTLKTLGPDDLNGSLSKIKALSAHYRYDADLDVLVGVGFKPGSPGHKPALAVLEYDRAFNTIQENIFHIQGLNYVHDFLMTPKYYIFHMTPFVDVGEKISKRIKKGEIAPGEAMFFNPDLPSRMVIVERNLSKDCADREIIEFETEPCHIYHFCNAVQVDSDTITFGATCLPPGFNMKWQHKVFLSNNADAQGVYHNYELRIFERKCTRTVSSKIVNRSNEFPTSNPYRHVVDLTDSQRKVLPPRYIYLMAGKPGVSMPFTDIVKFDEKGNRDDCWSSDGIVGEPVFAPRLGRASAFHGDDDDGWIITQLYKPGLHETEYIILDAKSLNKGPLARIRAPFHVPYSFHGTFSPQVWVHLRKSKL